MSLFPHPALFRHLPTAARVGLFLFFVAGFSDGMLMPFFALWASREAGIPTGAIGLLLGCYAGGELLATPLVGGIADRIGRRPVLILSTLGTSLGFFCLYFVNGTFAAALCLITIGIFESVLHPTAATVIADVVAPEKLRETYALRRVVSGIGHIIGPALGSLLAMTALGLVFTGAAGALLAGCIATLFFLKETRPAAAGNPEDEEEEWGALGTALRDRRLAALLLPVAAIGIVASWIETILPLYATTTGTLDPADIGWLFSYAGLVAVLFQLPLTRLSGRLAGSSLVSTSGLVLALSFALLLAAPTLPGLIVAVTLLTLAEMLSGPLTQTIASELAPARARATYMAAFSTANDLEDAAGPALGTWLYAVSASLPWLVALPVTLAATAALAAAARRHESRLEKPQDEGAGPG
ncbi:MDR family MFS transporter [Radicibacter daui]|uniref:MDR family MFS transporter n=1 Tax=Radicibacter daui TaxID=3064829 RepID=UPI004046FCAA